MYSTNINDFWFDFGIMIIPVLKIFLLLLISFSFVYTLIYLILKKKAKSDNLYYIILLATFIFFLASYIQGNYLIGNLPSLVGDNIDWSKYKIDNVITIIIWMILLIIISILCKKIKLEKVVKYSTYISMAIFGMLSVSLCTSVVQYNALKNKNGIYFTEDNINVASSKKNFFIFLIDSVNSTTLYEEWQNDEQYKELFNDFTFYNNALSTFPLTKNSIPQILTGKVNKNELEFSEFSSNAYNDSYLFQILKDKNYETNIYDYQIVWNGEKKFDIKNGVSNKNANINLFSFFKQETKYILYKYVPYGLKKYSKINTMDFLNCISTYDSDIQSFYNMINSNPNLEIDNENHFQFIHTAGAHVPFDLDSNLKKVTNGTYSQKVHGNLKLIKAYLDRLKSNNVYNNSVIILMADHGYNEDGNYLGRFNPFLAIKGINEKHDMIISDLPISFEDFPNAFTKLLEDKKSTELFNNLIENRERKVLKYSFQNEKHMVEYSTSGKAYDISKFKETGNVFDR